MKDKAQHSNDNEIANLQLQGLNEAKNKNYLKALAHFQAALKLNPALISLHINISNVYLHLNDIEKALQHINQALRLDPLNAEVYTNLGRVFYKQGLYDPAIKNFEKALRLDKDLVAAHYNLAHSLTMQNQLSRAATHYGEVLRLQPENAIANLNLGFLEFNEGDYLEAEIHLKKALQYDAKNLELIKKLGETYVALGKMNEAIETYLSALDLSQDLSDVHHNLAILYLQSQEKTKALEHFSRALALDPSNDTAKHMLHALRGEGVSETPPQYIANLFDQYADYYNEHLKNKLNYQAHVLLRNALGRLLNKNPSAGRILDLGCGTGLCGLVFRDLATDLIGVDLSPNMIEKARELGAYEKLIVSDINSYLEQSKEEAFDLIIAGDVLVYSGDLQKLFKNVAHNLKSEGRFAFTIEPLPNETKDDNFSLQPSGRFAHSIEYIHQLAEENDLLIEIEDDIVPREHEGRPITGKLFVTKRLV